MNLDKEFITMLKKEIEVRKLSVDAKTPDSKK
ncbi:sporulation histidine kinase inhibitor Sda [Domibacillus sp. PGB-M46]